MYNIIIRMVQYIIVIGNGHNMSLTSPPQCLYKLDGIAYNNNLYIQEISEPDLFEPGQLFKI